MDQWQKDLNNKLTSFIDDGSPIGSVPVTISINKAEAYVALKALEAQEKYENPVLIIPEDKQGTISKRPYHLEYFGEKRIS